MGWHGLYVTLFVYIACAMQVVAVAFHEHYEPAQGASQHPGPADRAASADLLTGARSSRLTERLSLASLAEIDEVGAACCWSAVRRCVLEIEVVNHSNVALQARPPYQWGVHFACLESHLSHRNVAVHARPHLSCMFGGYNIVSMPTAILRSRHAYSLSCINASILWADT